MGTKQQTLELQLQIRRLAAELGWTQNELARRIYTEINEWDDKEEIHRGSVQNSVSQ